MRYFFAPMEGITTHVFRRIHRKHFPGIDAYYTPFLVADQTRHFKKKEQMEIAPENNAGTALIPQILANDASQFLDAARRIGAQGYRIVDLNLGCPMPTVVTKKKGAGLLADPQALEALLEGIFSQRTADDPALSVKTRIGFEDASEAEELIDIYDRYPIARLTIHARKRADFYEGQPDLDTFGRMLGKSRIPICYNGDLFTAEDVRAFSAQFPSVEEVMIGRGLLRDPALVRILQGGAPASRDELHAFVTELYDAYCQSSYGAGNALYRMKELWSYLRVQFPDSPQRYKQILKAKTPAAYTAAVDELFSS